MKKQILLVAIMTTTAFMNAQVGCSVWTYQFTEGKNLQYPLWAVVKTGDDFLLHNIELLEGKGITMNYPNGNSMGIDLNGKVQKMKYSDFNKDYYGFVSDHTPYRVFIDEYNNYVARRLTVMGNICLYGLDADNPQKSGEEMHYKYCFYEFYSEFYFSIGINGPALESTHINFSNALKEIDPHLQEDYLNDLALLNSVKLEDNIVKNKKSLDLFIKYFEIVNNQEIETE